MHDDLPAAQRRCLGFQVFGYIAYTPSLDVLSLSYCTLLLLSFNKAASSKPRGISGMGKFYPQYIYYEGEQNRV